MSAWKSDEKLLSICILNFSFKNDFVWEEISNIRHSVSSPDETPRSSSKILRCVSYFQLSSRCFIWWWNTASHVWYITYGMYTVGANIKREMALSPNDEEVASSKKHTQFKTRVHKSYPISDQNGRNWHPISAQNG